jgi:hypothetical protein
MAGPTPVASLRNTPPDRNLSFGKNIFTLEDTGGATDQVKFALNILPITTGTTTTGSTIATLRQFENPSGTAHFDLQNILKNQTTPNPNLESITGLTDGAYETFRFIGQVGTDLDGFDVDEIASGTTGSYCVIGGRKPYYDLDWEDENQYVSRISELLGCPISRDRIFALSDLSGPKSSADTPAWVTGETVLTQTIPADTQAKRTLSFVNRCVPKAVALDDSRKTIGAIRVTIMSGSTQLDDFFIENIQSNGGGPNTVVGGTRYDEYPYDVITVQCGHNMYTGDTSNATHWFVASFVKACPADSDIFWDTPISNVYRFNVDDGSCNDFEYVDVSWLNSLGFRDYFTFRKRRDYDISINRNTYQQIDGTWGGQDYEVNTYDRGEKVFSQSLQERYTINTDYLSDEEAEFLKNLYLSPDVKVRFEGETDFYPVVLEDTVWTEKTFRKDKLFQATTRFRIAHKLNSLRG